MAKAKGPCQAFDATHRRWETDGIPYMRRCTEKVKYCPHHFGIAFPGYHIRTEAEEVFECSYCGCEFTTAQAAEADTR